MARDAQALLIHRTRRSGLRMAAGDGPRRSPAPAALRVVRDVGARLARVVATDVLEPGQKLRLVKLVGLRLVARAHLPALRDQVAAALVAAQNAGWDGLLAEQRAYLDDFWAARRRRARGRPRAAAGGAVRAVPRPSAGARAEGRAHPAKGLTGTGYDGHAFWDTELFIVPVLTYTAPEAAADALRWRHSTLDAARARARDLGLAARRFPGAPSTARSAPATGRPGPPRSTSTPTSPSSVIAVRPRHRRRRVRARHRASTSWSRPRACGARSGTTTSTAASASTASPAPTSTAPSPTTTSTRT